MTLTIAEMIPSIRTGPIFGRYRLYRYTTDRLKGTEISHTQGIMFEENVVRKMALLGGLVVEYSNEIKKPVNMEKKIKNFSILVSDCNSEKTGFFGLLAASAI